MEYQFNKGSEWRKWDLHFHTPSSYDYNNKSITNEDIITKLVADGISVVAITDHHTIDIERISELQVLSKGKLTILPGIEFCSELGGSESIHFIGIFPENADIKHIWTKIQGTLDLTDKGISDKGGVEHIHCDLLNTCELIHELGGLTTVHAGSKSNTVESIKNTTLAKMYQKKDILMHTIDFLELGKSSDINVYEDIVFKAIGVRRPLIICSDNHDINNYLVKENCWIKATPDFEGLKQSIYEPERVKIQKDHPNSQRAQYNIIEKLRFEDKSGETRFTDFEIGLSPYLNTIIGGKSSGKSLLMHMIASSLGNKTDSKDYANLTQNVSLKIYYADNPNQERESEDRRIIEFLPQLHIEKIVRKQSGTNNHKDFNDFIEDILKQNADVHNTFKKEKEIISNKKINLSTSITKWIQYDESYLLLREELLPLGDNAIIQKEIYLIRNQIESLKKGSGLTDTELELYNTLSLKNQRAENIILDIKEDIESFDILKQYIKDQIAADFENSITFQTENRLSLTFLKDVKEELSLGINKIINESILPRIEIQITRFNSRIVKLEQFILNNKKILQPYLEKAQIQDEVKKLEDREKIETDKIKLIKEKEDEIKREKAKRDEIDLIKIYTELKGVYAKLVALVNDEVSQKWDDGTSGLTLEASVNFNYEDFSSRVQALVNIKSSLENQFGNFLFDGNDFKYKEQDHIDKIKHFFQVVISDTSRFSNFKKGHKLEELINCIFDNFFFIDYDIKKGSDSIRNMSEGKKGIVILQLYLSLSNAEYPILIDQPEDNLDNRTVYKELNDFIKKSKQKRQIIMVSHNANLVVNTDAENIIVANQMGEDGKENKKFKFEYVNGALENTFQTSSEKGVLYQKGVKEHICEILEGGAEAFKSRERKYDLRNV